MDNEQLLGKLLMAEFTGFKPNSEEVLSSLIRIIDSQQKEILSLKESLKSLREDVVLAFKRIGHNF